MDIEQELKRLQATEREYMEYLRAQCESVGADTNVEGLENPRLALACRYALADSKISLRDRFAMAALTGLATQQETLLANQDLLAEFGTAGIDKLQANKAYRLADAMLAKRSKQ